MFEQEHNLSTKICIFHVKKASFWVYYSYILFTTWNVESEAQCEKFISSFSGTGARSAL